MESGYEVATMQQKLRWLADLGLWLGRRGLTVKDLDEQRIEPYFAGRRQNGLGRRGDRTTVRQLLDNLREHSVVQCVTPTRDTSPPAAILDGYEKHLRSERGLEPVMPFMRVLYTCGRS